jgi:hypothetical protein
MVTAMVVTAVMAAVTCCSSTAAATLCGALLVPTAVLPVARGTLDECRLMVMDASALSALAGVRGGRSAPPCERKDRRIKLLPLENGASGGAMAYLRVEKPRFLFLEGLTGAEAAADIATVTLPDASVARAGASATRAASSVDRPAAGASAPAKALAPLPPPRLSVRGAQAPTS